MRSSLLKPERPCHDGKSIMGALLWQVHLKTQQLLRRYGIKGAVSLPGRFTVNIRNRPGDFSNLDDRSQQQDLFVAVINGIKLRNRQRVGSSSGFDGVSGPLEFFNKPVLISVIIRFVRRHLKCITACPGKGFSDLPCAGNLHILVQPINHLTMGMICQYELEIMLSRKIDHGLGFRL